MSLDIKPEDVRANLGPPSYLETLLADIGKEKGKINEALESFLTLPYVSAIKVTNRSGAEVSLYDQVKVLKGKYERLQARTVPIAEELGAYARLSELLLPTVSAEGGLTLDEFLLANTPLVLKYGKEAKSLAKETAALRDEFQALLELLEYNLGQVLQQINQQEHALEEAEAEYKFEMVTAIISGIITLGFVIGAIVALCTGNVPVAAELAVDAGLGLYETIKSTIKAVGLAKVITNLKAAITTSKETKKNLEILIPAFKDIILMLAKIGDAWDQIECGLANVKDNYLAWENPKLFTPAMLSDTMEAWRGIRKAVETYVSIITGADVIVSAFVKNSAMQPSLMSIKESFVDSLEAPPDYSSLESIAPAYELARGQASSIAMQSIFSAPVNLGPLIQPWQLSQLSDQYNGIAQHLNSASQSDVSQQCAALGTYLSQYVVPTLGTAAQELRRFAARQPEIPDPSISKIEWQTFCVDRIATLERGLYFVRNANENVHSLNMQANSLNNNLIARMQELRITIEKTEQQMYLAEAQRREFERQMSMNPFGAFIRTLIDAVTGELQKLNQKRQETAYLISHFNDAIGVISTSKTQLQVCSSQTASLEGVYNDLLNGMQSATTVWPVLHTLNLQPAEVALYKSTWELVTAAIGNW
ncbi:hypothetical protein MN608_09004 [Microdochium nivale]|nr:hypothetical protein MN608_09004 [Microdochium nivale]